MFLFKIKITFCTETCEDDPNWLDDKFGDGTGGCAHMTTDWCQKYGDYASEAKCACPKTCGVCSSGIYKLI